MLRHRWPSMLSLAPFAAIKQTGPTLRLLTSRAHTWHEVLSTEHASCWLPALRGSSRIGHATNCRGDPHLLPSDVPSKLVANYRSKSMQLHRLTSRWGGKRAPGHRNDSISNIARAGMLSRRRCGRTYLCPATASRPIHGRPNNASQGISSTCP